MSEKEKLINDISKIKDVLVDYIDKINYFDDGLLYIDVIDKNGEVLCEYNTVLDFYRDCVGINLPSKEISQIQPSILSMKM